LLMLKIYERMEWILAKFLVMVYVYVYFLDFVNVPNKYMQIKQRLAWDHLPSPRLDNHATKMLL